LNGASTVTAVTSVTIQPKKANGRGVNSSRICRSAVAASAAMPAPTAICQVLASPKAPSPLGASTGMSKSPRAMTVPTTAMSAATSAVAVPPNQRVRASTLERPVAARGYGSDGCTASLPSPELRVLAGPGLVLRHHVRQLRTDHGPPGGEREQHDDVQ